ncbi:hypothetical protein EIN_025450 [Entamoeba invadens IP1]|uniref:hypothetical protein n=1 Tax=Entamoeba invadens IP1 TaxID=370355 RepID=UPI0002C3EB6F|nr:hypothetical protein EIN_025450 [Entamoeba invadens IP1]ELP90726.1 hypothetical protein EIN_025450 [Entamoeba invadens IP1]|eukprot:XP_004257497.1 hypothetical protein EIN_025450 [Entamoeba invadens IP1]
MKVFSGVFLIFIVASEAVLCQNSREYKITQAESKSVFQLMYGENRREGEVGCGLGKRLANWLHIENKTKQIVKVLLRYYSIERNNKKVPLHVSVNEKCPSGTQTHCIGNFTQIEPKVGFMVLPGQSVYIASFANDKRETFVTTEWIQIKTKPTKNTIGKSKITLLDLDTIEVMSANTENYLKHLDKEIDQFAAIPQVERLPESALQRAETSRVNEPIQLNITQQKKVRKMNQHVHLLNESTPQKQSNTDTSKTKKVTLKTASE